MAFFISGLTLLFIYLKMTSQIDWSWLWVLSPIWIDILGGLLILCISDRFFKKVVEKIFFSKFKKEIK